MPDPSPTSPLCQTVPLLGHPFSNVTERDVADLVARELAAGRGGWIVTANLDILRQIVTSPQIGALLSHAEMCVADGMPLIWASRLQRTPLPERVAGSDLVYSLTARAAAEGRSVFLLGGNPGAAEGAAKRFTELHPRLRIAGFESPPFGFDRDEAYLADLERRLVELRPDIVYVALGCPKQDHLITRLKPRLRSTWFMGVGISLSFVTGEVQRAPRIFQRLGLEWVHRMIQEPRRLMKRYLVYGIPFAVRLLVTSAFSRPRMAHR